MEVEMDEMTTTRSGVSRATGLRASTAVLVVATAAMWIVTGCAGTPVVDDRPVVEGFETGNTEGQTVVDQNALKEFDKAVELYKAAPRTAVPYGQIEAQLKKALQIDANFARAYYNLGVLAQMQGKDDEAITYYQDAYKRDGKSVDPLVNTAVIFLKRGDEAKANDMFLKAVEIEPFNPAARNNLAVYYRKQKDYPKSVVAGRRALAGDSQSLDAYHSLARIYFDLDKYVLARLVCFNALQFDPTHPGIHNMLGLIYLKLNNVTLALKEFRLAVEGDPQYDEAHMNIGAISLSIRDYQTAVNSFNEVIKRRPKDVDALLSLAVAKRSVGDLDGAMAGYKAVLEVAPEHGPAYFNIAVMHHEIYAQEAEDPAVAVKHYQDAIENYRKFLSVDTTAPPEVRKDADQRIGNCTKLIQTQDQLKEMLKMQADMERQQAAEEAAAGGTGGGDGDGGGGDDDGGGDGGQ